jgi:hypothetical protein
MNPIFYIILARPGSRELLGGRMFWNYNLARSAAGKLGGIVSNMAWYSRRFGVDPSLLLKLSGPRSEDRPRMGRPPGRGRRAEA